MKIRIIFITSEDWEDEELINTLITLILSAIEDELHYLPALDIRGKKRLSVSFFNLSKRETDVILGIIMPEKVNDGLIDRIIVSQPKEENPTDKVFMFTPPGYRSKEDEEKASERKRHGMDMERMVRRILIINLNVIYDVLIEKDPDWKLPPLTTKAMLQIEDLREDEDYLAQRIASEKMPKDRVLRRPRRPRNRTRRISEASAPLDEDTRL